MNGQQELTAVTGSENNVTQTADAEIAFDNAFSELRTELAKAYEALIIGGVRFFRVDNIRLTLEQLLAIAPEGAKRYYKCQACGSFLRRFSGLVVMNDDGTLRSVFADVLAQNKYFADRINEAYPEWFATVGMRGRVHATPVATLNSGFAKAIDHSEKAEDGIFTHLHGCDSKQLQGYNDQCISRDAMKRAKEVWENMQSIVVSGEKMIVLQGRLQKEIHHPEAVGLLTPYANVLEKIRGMKMNQVRYLASLLMTSDYSWLNSIEGTVAGKVLDELRDQTITAANVSERLTQLVRKIKAYTAPGVYKEKTAESSVGLLNSTVSLLKEKGWDEALARQIVSLDDLPLTWRPCAIIQKEEVAEEQPTSSLDAAAGKLLKNKSSEKTSAALEEGIEIFAKAVTGSPIGISLKAFDEKLSEFAKIEVSSHGAPLFPCLVTAPVDGKAYPELIKYTMTKEMNDKGYLVIMTTNPVAIPIVVGALTGKFSKSTEGFPDGNDPFYEASGYMVDSGAGTRVFLRGIADYFAECYKDLGSMLLGVNIAQPYFNHSRALCEISKNIPLKYEGAETSSGAGSLAVTAGMLFRCTKHDGTVELHSITCVE